MRVNTRIIMSFVEITANSLETDEMGMIIGNLIAMTFACFYKFMFSCTPELDFDKRNL